MCLSVLKARAHKRIPNDRFIDTLHIKLRVGGVFGFVTDEPALFAFVGKELHRTFADWDVVDPESQDVGHLAPRDGDFDRRALHQVWLRKSKPTTATLAQRLRGYDFSRLKLAALVK